MKILTGNTNPQFAERICSYLDKKLCNVEISKFADGETSVVIKENVRHQNCFIVQSTCSNKDKNISVNDSIIELLIMVDALKRGSASQVNVVIPYYGYSRQDRKDYSRAPISAAVVAKCLESQNINRVIVFDLHAGQIAGFFSNNCPLDNLYAEKYFLTYITRDLVKEKKISLEDIIIVAPDEGAVKNVIRISKRIGCQAATIFKNRSKPNEIESMNLMGDVNGKIAVMVDDIIDTGGTMIKASELLIDNGAIEVYMMACHGLFSKNALVNIEKSKISKVIVTNTVTVSEAVKNCKKISVIDVSWVCAEAIRRQNNGESLKELYASDFDSQFNYPINFV